MCLRVHVWASNDDGWFKPKAQTDLINSVSEYHWREKAQEKGACGKQRGIENKRTFL